MKGKNSPTLERWLVEFIHSMMASKSFAVSPTTNSQPLEKSPKVLRVGCKKFWVDTQDHQTKKLWEQWQLGVHPAISSAGTSPIIHLEIIAMSTKFTMGGLKELSKFNLMYKNSGMACWHPTGSHRSVGYRPRLYKYTVRLAAFIWQVP